MKLLLVLRLCSLLVAGISFALLVFGVPIPRLARIARLAVVGASFAQLSIDASNARAGRAPWTKVAFALIACAASLEFAFTGQPPLLFVVAVGLIEVGVIGYVIARVLRSRDARTADDMPEDAIVTAYARFAPEGFARFAAAESMIVLSAFRYVFGGFRKVRPVGFHYDVQSMYTPFLLAMPLFVIPEMLVLDVILWHAPWGWRLLNEGVHVYALIWAFGLVALFRNRPHQILGERAILRLGPFRRIVVPLDAIASTHPVPDTLGGRGIKKLAAGDPQLLVPGAPTVCIVLRAPLAGANRIFVLADDPSGLMRALVA